IFPVPVQIVPVPELAPAPAPFGPCDDNVQSFLASGERGRDGKGVAIDDGARRAEVGLAVQRSRRAALSVVSNKEGSANRSCGIDVEHRRASAVVNAATASRTTRPRNTIRVAVWRSLRPATVRRHSVGGGIGGESRIVH